MVAGPGHGHDRSRHHVAVGIEARQPLNPAERDDRHLRRVDDRHGVGAAQHADVGDADGAALQIAGFDSPLAGRPGQAFHLARHFAQAQPLDVLDVGHQQAAGAVHRHADIAGGLIMDGVGCRTEPAVEQRKRRHRQRQRLHQQRHQRQPLTTRLEIALEAFPQRQQLGDVELVAVGKMRNRRRRFAHPPRHHRTHTAQRLGPLVGGSLRHWRSTSRRCGFRL